MSVLTSLDTETLAEIGIDSEPASLVEQMAAMAQRAGAEGVVCSPHEIEVVSRAAPQLSIVTPGIRPPGVEAGDQRRTATPRQALAAGADWLVVGRPITAAPDPGAAAAEILSGINV